MNQHLQELLDFIKKADHLTDEEKTALSKAAKAADKELEITSFKLERTEKVKHTTAILLEETIEELEQKRKAVEAQNRELEIESALEKVRSSSLAMYKSDELKQAVKVVFKELQGLDFAIDGAAFIVTPIENSKDFNVWIGDDHAEYPNCFRTPFYDTPSQTDIVKAMESGANFFSRTYSFEEKNSWFKYAFEHTDYKDLPPELKTWILEQQYLTQSIAWANKSGVGIHFHQQRTLTENEIDILKRFSKVFDQAYIRFLDLQKAEAQAREAQIEAALERVRAASMAMHRSEELPQVALVLLEQLEALGVSDLDCNINIVDSDTKDFISYSANNIKENNQVEFHQFPKLNLNDFGFLRKAADMTDSGHTLFTLELKDELYEEIIGVWDTFGYPGLKNKNDFEAKGIIYMHCADFNRYSSITTTSLERLSEEKLSILQRMAKAFGMSYTRFLDLQKAEAQARDAQIEAALERVRSRSIAMRKSEEIADIAARIFSELRQLDLALNRVLIWTFNDAEKYTTWWSANPEVESTAESYRIDYNENPVFINYLQAWQQRKPIHLYFLAGDTKNSWSDFLFEHTEMSRLPEEVRKSMRDEGDIYTVSVISDYGLMMTGSLEPLSDTTIDIIQRFGRVFQQSYTRYLDVQKAEVQAREAQIEAALERLRARSMAMHKTDELHEASKVLFQELAKLGFSSLVSGFGLMSEDEKTVWYYFSNAEDGATTSEPMGTPCKETAPMRTLTASWKQQEPYHIVELDAKETIVHQTFIAERSINAPFTAAELISMTPKELKLHSFNFKQGYLLQGGGEKLSDDKINIMIRFTKVFEMTYRRFLDLQKAEAQAREAQVEAALERVRAQSMAMHKSDDLRETVARLYKEIRSLGFETPACVIVLYNEINRTVTHWVSGFAKNVYPQSYSHPYFDHPYFHNQLDALKSGVSYKVFAFEGRLKKSYDKLIFSLGDMKDFPEAAKMEVSGMEKIVLSDAFMKYGMLEVFSDRGLDEEHARTLQRFSQVFEQTYTRFLDLQKAEAQAREAQIEAALERVRSLTMAMQKSEDLNEAASDMFKQIQSLGMQPWGCGFNIFDKDEKVVTQYMSLADGGISPPFRTPLTEDPFFINIYDARKRGDELLVMESSGESLAETYRYMFGLPGSGEIFGDLENSGFEMPKFQITHCAYFSQGYIVFITYEPVPEAHDIFKRFAKVFDQTYTRFLDLQKAEAQAREAQIETALERIRSRTMAMQKSDELSDVASLLFQQIGELGIKVWTAGFNVWLNNDAAYQDWITSPMGGFIEPYLVDTTQFPVFIEVREAKQRGDDFFVQYVGGEMIKAMYGELSKFAPKQFEIMLRDGFEFLKHQYDHFVFGATVSLMFITYEPIPEAHDIFKRFGKVFEQTYTRFLDLQKAEAATKEAIKQAALDRIRGDIASMRTIADLDKITPIIWNELVTLGVSFIRCGVFIMDNEQELIHTYLSTPDGKSIAAFHLPFDTPGHFSEIVDDWKNKKIYVGHWNENDFNGIAETLVKRGAIETREQYLNTLPQGGFYLHFLPFLQGMLYVGNTSELNEEDINLIQSIAETFATAYARYEDFNKLELAKQQIEKTYSELKSTQSQLIQSEKMASLGELTAGIAHEIQNPLNFVNNFSEVSNELIEEMKQELATGHWQLASEIADDVKRNLEKILHHGKRADGIVKGMLQHSRTSSGQKEPTGINALCDEYVRLAYHGLRAKDKSFNAKFETDFDPSISKINIVPQDIGRVVLNLINNAFYAVSEKKRNSNEKYEPTVIVSTKKLNDKIEIEVSDNGNGIPQNVVDKIFQPFFTTKPTGQGTGLGLSLSYDIVKAHGGELKVETKEGAGSEFAIYLPIS